MPPVQSLFYAGGVLLLAAGAAAARDDALVHRAPFEVLDGEAAADCSAPYQVKLRIALRSDDVIAKVSGAPDPVDLCHRTERRGAQVVRIEVPCGSQSRTGDRTRAITRLTERLKQSEVSVSVVGELCVSPWSQTATAESGTVSIAMEGKDWEIPVDPERVKLKPFVVTHQFFPEALRDKPLLEMALDCLPLHRPDEGIDTFYLSVAGTFLLADHALDWLLRLILLRRDAGPPFVALDVVCRTFGRLHRLRLPSRLTPQQGALP